MARYIDADALKEQMKSVCMGIMSGTDSYNAPLKTIDDAPTTDVRENIRAKWVCDTKNNTGWHCSNCHRQAPFWCMASTQELSNYCQNCGAEMAEGGEE